MGRLGFRLHTLPHEVNSRHYPMILLSLTIAAELDTRTLHRGLYSHELREDELQPHLPTAEMQRAVGTSLRAIVRAANSGHAHTACATYAVSHSDDHARNSRNDAKTRRAGLADNEWAVVLIPRRQLTEG